MLENAGIAKESDAPGFLLNADEKNLVILLNKFETIIIESAADYNPAVVANYLFDLAKTYNKFYNDNPILKAEDKQQFRLELRSEERRVGNECVSPCRYRWTLDS